MLSLLGVFKRYGATTALTALDLVVPASATTALIGPSGCGKSTILRLMTGLIHPDQGSIRFEQTALTAANIQQLRRRMGYVIQEGGLFPHLNAQANVTLMPRYLRWPKPRIEQRVNELADLVQLPRPVLRQYPAELSGGQRQRVSLMRALMLDPDVLLLDEPLAALDPMIRHDLQNDLKRIFQTLCKTVVLVTHDIGEAGFFSDLIVLLRAGRIVQQGTLRDLVTRPSESFVERFINAQRSPLETIGRQP